MRTQLSIGIKKMQVVGMDKGGEMKNRMHGNEIIEDGTVEN